MKEKQELIDFIDDIMPTVRAFGHRISGEVKDLREDVAQMRKDMRLMRLELDGILLDKEDSRGN